MYYELLTHATLPHLALLGARVPLRFDSWDEALATVGELARNGPLAIVLDEFQWLTAAQPSLESIVQRYWDEWQRDRVPVTLILSGSALRLMEGLLEPGRSPSVARRLASSAPIYGAFIGPCLGFAGTLRPNQFSCRFDLADGIDALGTFLELGELVGIGLVENPDAVALDAGKALQAHAGGEHQRRMGVATEVIWTGRREARNRLADGGCIAEIRPPAIPLRLDSIECGPEMA